MNKEQKIIILCIFLLGILSPFIPFLGIAFLVSIPFLLVLTVAAGIYWITTFFKNKSNRKDALFLLVLIPLFFLSQLLAIYSVNKTQRIRSESCITKIEAIKKETGHFPATYKTSFGIEYFKLTKNDSYKITYSRGFLVTEQYTSEMKTWKSYGWND